MNLPRNAGGIYTQPAGTAAVSNQIESSSAYNTLASDLGSEITNSLDRLGRSPMQAALPMGAFNLQNLADPVNPQDGVTKNYVDTRTLALWNRIINGAMDIDQRNVGGIQTFTAAAALAYSVDRWYGYCTGANVTGARTSNIGASGSPSQFVYLFAGAAGVTGIGFGQRIESANSYDLAGTTATLSFTMMNTTLTSVTWTAYYANSTDTFGTLAAPTRTQIATGTITINNSYVRYSTSIAIPAAATTGIEIVFTVGAQISGNWAISNVQLIPGNYSASPVVNQPQLERRPRPLEVALCQRYYEVGSAFLQSPAVGSTGTTQSYNAWKRVNPIVTFSGITYNNANTLVLQNVLLVGIGTQQAFAYNLTSTSASGYVQFQWNSSAEL